MENNTGMFVTEKIHPRGWDLGEWPQSWVFVRIHPLCMREGGLVVTHPAGLLRDTIAAMKQAAKAMRLKEIRAGYPHHYHTSP